MRTNTLLAVGRMELRSWSLCQARALFHLLDRNRFYLRGYYSWVDDIHELDDVNPWIEKAMNENRSHRAIHCGIWLDATRNGTLIGSVSLTHLDRDPMIGLWFDQDIKAATDLTLPKLVATFVRGQLGSNPIRRSPSSQHPQTDTLLVRSGLSFTRCRDDKPADLTLIEQQ